MLCACCCSEDKVGAESVETLQPLPLQHPLHKTPGENDIPKEEPNKGSIAEPENKSSVATLQEEFVVEVEKTAEQSKIGLEVDKLWGRVLITKINKGLIDDYNQRASCVGLREVKVGYLVAGVNGVTDSPHNILKAIAADKVLRITIRVPKKES
eukprot:CAMPEP_0170591406 /NCGR_PEP_ID=MMETSP0224-20130122/12387_1 /TAXON_ID=285029 /ORGANISM="Togula jolla, Strain CCCM 725" /LENGTH=153 /DNA_ID=CAMNT_0010915269 /DNA_START=37 /DNA_END=498 /DNA_ORIENTATION=+